MKSVDRLMNKYAIEIASAKDKIMNLFDDAIEEDDLNQFNELVTALYAGKFSEPVKLEILTQAMDTAYRGTKVTPPTQHSAAIVAYLARLGIPVPTYPFSTKVRLN